MLHLCVFCSHFSFNIRQNLDVNSQPIVHAHTDCGGLRIVRAHVWQQFPIDS